MLIFHLKGCRELQTHYKELPDKSYMQKTEECLVKLACNCKCKLEVGNTLGTASSEHLAGDEEACEI